jgi:hypothetical protein
VDGSLAQKVTKVTKVETLRAGHSESWLGTMTAPERDWSEEMKTDLFDRRSRRPQRYQVQGPVTGRVGLGHDSSGDGLKIEEKINRGRKSALFVSAIIASIYG